jgi:hypothetical protein
MLVTGVFSSASAQNSAPVVVELFTSQGCYSCPPAEAYLGELADRTDIVALEFHVDYWDSLTYMWHGQWKDPFSSPQYTARQRDYNVAIRGQSGVYTPQMIIDGRYEAVGSRRPQVADAIDRASQARKLEVAVAPASGGGALEVTLSGSAGGADTGDVYLARFLDRAETEVKKGENHGKILVSRHIVRELRKLGGWRGTARKLRLPADALADNPDGKAMGCAVLVQAPNHGRILGAALCPRGPAS